MRLPFFLELACEWWAVSDALRSRGVPHDEPALTVWREAAWFHLLLSKGRYCAVLARLRVVFEGVTGLAPPFSPSEVGQDEVLVAATDLFTRMYSCVSARYPIAFAGPAAA